MLLQALRAQPDLTPFAIPGDSGNPLQHWWRQGETSRLNETTKLSETKLPGRVKGTACFPTSLGYSLVHSSRWYKHVSGLRLGIRSMPRNVSTVGRATSKALGQLTLGSRYLGLLDMDKVTG